MRRSRAAPTGGPPLALVGRAMPSWILRQGSKSRGFRYVTESGRAIADRRTLARIDALRVPPAWTEVHVALSPASEVQAWGFDAKGRKQYRYHARATARGALRKYYRVRQMAHDLPTIRIAVRRRLRELERGDLSRPAVAAAVVRLIADGFFRVGSDRYAKENGSFGATTLRKRHLRREGDLVVLAYRGKSGVRQRQAVTDRSLSRVVERLERTPGPRLFRYQDETGHWHDLAARDVNAFLRELVGVPYTAKDFRTWGGTLRAATVLSDLDPDGSASPRERQRNVVTAMRLVSSELGNTPTVCRASYVHPLVVARYLDEGETIAAYLSPRGRRGAGRGTAAAGVAAQHAPEERALIAFLDKHFPERRRRPREDRAA
jgi:DNA topoisomerase I